MKKFVAFVMILSLGMLTIGCNPPAPATTPVKPGATDNKDKGKAPAGKDAKDNKDAKAPAAPTTPAK